MPAPSARTSRRPLAARLLLVLAVALVLAPAACGGSSGGDGAARVATLATGGEGSDAVARRVPRTGADREDTMLDYARCLREHGVDLPDPNSTGGPGAGSQPAPVVGFEEADRACEPILRDVDADAPDVSPEQEVEGLDQALVVARCLRKHGVDVPDPSPGRAAVLLPPGAGRARSRAQKALTTCNRALRPDA